jgi:carboxyl-terminal processing protease
LSHLDPHSVYISPSEQTQVAESMKGDFVGIELISIYKDSVAIIRPWEWSFGKLQPEDRILYADRTKLFGRKLPSDSLFSKLKGEQGSVVELTIYRKSADKKSKSKKRGYSYKECRCGSTFEWQYGLYKINRFAETTFEEFKMGLLN